MSDKEFDKIFKSRLRNREFDFNPENWKAMEQMLDKRPAAAAFYWWSTAAILMFGILAFTALNFSYSPVSRDVKKMQNTITNTRHHDPEAISTDKNSPIIEVSGTENHESSTIKPATYKKADITDESKIPVFHTSPQNENSIPHPGSPNHIIVSKPLNKQNQIFAAIPVEGDVADANSAGNIAEENYRFKNLEVKAIPSLFSLTNRELLALYEPDPYSFDRFNKQQEWWISLGPNFSRGINSTQMATAWFAEVSYVYRFSYKWSFEAGLGYFARNSPDLNWSSDSVFYNFGQEVLRTEVENKRLDYINLPLKVSYNFNARHQLNAGIYTALLLNVQRNVKQTHILFKGNTKVLEMKENGISGNFRRLDYGFNMGYLYQYSPQLGLGVQFQTGLSDITKDKEGVSGDFHRNIQTRLVLRYRLF